MKSLDSSTKVVLQRFKPVVLTKSLTEKGKLAFTECLLHGSQVDVHFTYDIAVKTQMLVSKYV